MLFWQFSNKKNVGPTFQSIVFSLIQGQGPKKKENLGTNWSLLAILGIQSSTKTRYSGPLQIQGEGGEGGTMYFALTISAPLSPTAQLSLYDQTFKSLKHHYSLTVRARDLKFWDNVHHTQCVTCHKAHVTCHMLHVTCHMSHVTCPMSHANLWNIITPKPLKLGTWHFETMFTTHCVSRVIYHMSHVTCHMSHVTCHMSNLQNFITPKPLELGTWNFEAIFTTTKELCVTCHMSSFTRHMSNVTCQMSPVTCHMSHVTCQIFKKIITSKPLELGAWNFGTMFTTPYLSLDTFHISCVTYHMSHVTCHMSYVKFSKYYHS